MKVISIKDNICYLKEYIKYCSLEWGCKKTKEELDTYVENKLKKISTDDKTISVLGLIDHNELLGFISLFKYDGDERRDLTPWYATMYVKKEYRGKGYSKLLNDAILEEANILGYDLVYLNTDLNNYYEKFEAKFIDVMNNGEKLYCIKTVCVGNRNCEKN